MIKTACFLTGDNHRLLAVDTPASKKKVVAMGIAMMVPTMIWIFNGFMLSHQVLKAGIGWSVITALACGVIVFFIEKLIIMANGNGWLTFFRICIGLLVAFLGSLAIDEVIFKNDIDISVAAIKEESVERSKDNASIDFKKRSGYSELEMSIAAAQAKYDNAVSSVIAEADGTSGTRTRGVGGITKLKNRKALDRKAELDELNSKRANLDHLKDSFVNVVGKTTSAAFNEHALLTRVKALFRLVEKDEYMLTTYIVFTLLMFFFEFLVVILKCTWKKTNYERKLEMIEEIGRRRMEFLQQQNSPLTDPGHYLPQLEQARIAVKKSQSIYN